MTIRESNLSQTLKNFEFVKAILHKIKILLCCVPEVGYENQKRKLSETHQTLL